MIKTIDLTIETFRKYDKQFIELEKIKNSLDKQSYKQIVKRIKKDCKKELKQISKQYPIEKEIEKYLQED